MSTHCCETLYIHGRLEIFEEVPLKLGFKTFDTNFYNFYQSFMKRKCDNCKESNKLALCLLCGVTMCVRSCLPSELNTRNCRSLLTKAETVPNTPTNIIAGRALSSSATTATSYSTDRLESTSLRLPLQTT